MYVQAVKCYEAICGSGIEEPTQEARIRLELAGLLLQRSYNLDKAREHLERAVRNPRYHTKALASQQSSHTERPTVQELLQGWGKNMPVTLLAHHRCSSYCESEFEICVWKVSSLRPHCRKGTRLPPQHLVACAVVIKTQERHRGAEEAKIWWHYTLLLARPRV